MQTTKAAKVYGAILANPGITAREINKMLGTADIGSCLNSFVKRGAVLAMPGMSERSTKYFKGRAPVILRQAAGESQSRLEQEIAELENSVNDALILLEQTSKQLKRLSAKVK